MYSTCNHGLTCLICSVAYKTDVCLSLANSHNLLFGFEYHPSTPRMDKVIIHVDMYTLFVVRKKRDENIFGQIAIHYNDHILGWVALF